MNRNGMAIDTPDWLSFSSVMQINPRTFSREGTIAAVTNALPELAAMGFGVMYLCPIFQEDDRLDPAFLSPRQIASETGNPKNPYRMNDYFAIDEEYGSMDDLRRFVQESHRLGMRVLLDLVYFHIGPNAPVIASHPDYILRDEKGDPALGEWRFPRLNYENRGLREYLMCNMTYYVGAIDVDGFRCDVGDKVPLDFWKEAKERMTAIKPDAVLINEGSRYDYLTVCFNSNYCYSWHEALYDVYCRGTKPASAIIEAYQKVADKLPENGLLLRDLDNHDTVTDWPVRSEIAAGHLGMEQMQVINYLIDGIPMIYGGNEMADTASLSLFANRFFPGKFGTTDRHAAGEAVTRRQEVYRFWNRVKKTNRVLRYGTLTWLTTDAPDRSVAFCRTLGEDRIVFVGNTCEEPLTLTVFQTVLPKLILDSGAVTVYHQTVTLPAHGYGVFSTKEL